MGNILLQNTKQAPQTQGNYLLNRISNLKQLGPSKMVFNRLYQSNPQFKQFADQMGNMTPEEAFRKNGLDYESFKGYKW